RHRENAVLLLDDPGCDVRPERQVRYRGTSAGEDRHLSQAVLVLQRDELHRPAVVRKGVPVGRHHAQYAHAQSGVIRYFAAPNKRLSVRAIGPPPLLPSPPEAGGEGRGWVRQSLSGAAPLRSSDKRGGPTAKPSNSHSSRSRCLAE